jgi:hypothetical protein
MSNQMQTKRQEINRDKTNKHRKLQKEFNYKKLSKRRHGEREIIKEDSYS